MYAIMPNELQRFLQMCCLFTNGCRGWPLHNVLEILQNWEPGSPEIRRYT